MCYLSKKERKERLYWNIVVHVSEINFYCIYIVFLNFNLVLLVPLIKEEKERKDGFPKKERKERFHACETSCASLHSI